MPVWQPAGPIPPTPKTVQIAGDVGIDITLPFVFVTLPLKVRDY
jgi:hypothetical protein